MKLNQYVEQAKFGSGLPQGDTIINLETTDVEETEFEQVDGSKQKKWILTTENNDTYIVGITVMSGIQEARDKGFSKVRVTKTGFKLDTKYTVIGLKNETVRDVTPEATQ
ncbi:MAG: hypothetical protein CL528_13330 [Aequorivita sp.]|jgi:hypothetical protein|nr:hypothetical protein [Aequorivita sp.]|tara:strand:+ start:2351 stop:2680 length:330 start_codon:yes stop_codon:yes gene_type:complete